MTFVPVIPFDGLAGWAFLNRTMERQKMAHSTSGSIQAQSQHFRENIANALRPTDITEDRRLLNVALTAFGLQEDIENRAFIERILEDGSLKENALANRLSDKRYLQLSKAFGFGDFSVPNTQISDFADKIIAKFHDNAFLQSIGTQSEDLRLALNFQAEVEQTVGSAASVDLGWYKLLGNKPLRQVVEVALGMPAGAGGGDIDQQLRLYQGRLERMFGSPDLAQFSEPEKQEKMIRLFLVRSEINTGTINNSSASVALSLLQTMPEPANN